MALGPEGMATGCSKCNQKRCIELDSKSAAVLLSPEDNRRAATLFLNLAQTLLNLPRITWARAAAPALEAATVSFFHSLLSQEVRNLTPTCSSGYQQVTSIKGGSLQMKYRFRDHHRKGALA